MSDLELFYVRNVPVTCFQKLSAPLSFVTHSDTLNNYLYRQLVVLF